MEFSFTPNATDWVRIAPELVVAAAALVVLLADLVVPARRHAWLAVIGLLGVIGAGVAVGLLLANGETGEAFFHMVSSDQVALLADCVILFACGLALLFSPDYLARQGVTQHGEYYALLLLATAGMMLMASATNLMTIFVALEVFSLALYILCAYLAQRFRSQEAGMKYFLLSSFASAFLLYGMALVYGSTGQTALAGIRGFLTTHPFRLTSGFGPMLIAALALLAVGFCFKVSAIPFQAWTPDVYVGAPTTVTAFMSVGTKVAAFVAMGRVFLFALPAARAEWQPILWAVAVLTLIGGNLLAVTQTDVKRLLAYSSVAHAGYILVGVVVGTALGYAAVLVYLASYAVMNIGAFGVVLVLERRDGQGTGLEDYAGLGRRRPALAAALAVCLFALAGVPPSAGFIAKWDIFYAAIVGGHTELAIIGLAASVLGMFYYLRVIWAMYFAESPAALAGGVIVASTTRRATGGPARPAGAPAVAATSAGGTAASATAVALAAPASPAAATGSAAAAAKSPAKSPAVANVPAPVAWAAGVALAIATILTIALGIVPGPLFTFAARAAGTLLR